jgi:hypothetical protein
VRERLQDIVDIHERKPDRRLRHFSCLSPSGAFLHPRYPRNHCASRRQGQDPGLKPPADFAFVAVLWQSSRHSS